MNPGTQIAHYRITAKLGQGGMGAVYRATDTKLDREVAIKVLPESFAQDKERLARFDREAKALAALNHPNIAGIFGIEQTGDTKALVLELVEGEDLSDRLKRGPLPVDEALDVCKQIAEALEAAHEKGIIHRDLKPGNVKLTADGKVKVLDFGLAKAVDPSPDPAKAGPPSPLGGERAGVRGDAVTPDSPTITENFTMPGTLLGTAGYMSPEQARGKPVDKRSDIWSFGCVLWECLTARRLFTGETVTDSIGALLHREIDWKQLPPNTPPTIQLLLRKCLARDRKRRLHDIADARVDLEQAITDPGSSFVRLGGQALEEAVSPRGISRLKAAGFVLLACMATAAMMWRFQPAPETETPVRRLSVDPGAAGSIFVDRASSVRLSPDGSTLAFVFVPEHDQEDHRQLFVRRMDELVARALPGTEGVYEFCFSPDSRWIAFKDQSGIKRIPVDGGVAISIGDRSLRGGVRGIEWPAPDAILLGHIDDGISQVSVQNGASERLTTLDEGEKSHIYPQLLPGGRALLYTARGKVGDTEARNVAIKALPGGSPRIVAEGGYGARYVPADPVGHLLYVKRGTLFASPFDLESLETKGPEVPLVDGVQSSPVGFTHYTVSDDGTLVYVPGTEQEVGSYRVDWVDREGNRTELQKLPVGYYDSFELSPNGRSVVYQVHDGVQWDIWILNLDHPAPIRLTNHPADDRFPEWSPTGRSIVFSSDRDGVRNLYWIRVDGGGLPQRLLNSPVGQGPWSWHPSGRYLAISQEETDGRGLDLYILNLEGNDETGWTAGEVEEFEATPAWEISASFSPDGKWLAYASTEGRTVDVYVQRFPEKGGKVRVSAEKSGSVGPVWSRSTNLLYFSSQVENEHQVFMTGYAVKDGEFLPNPEGATRWPGATYRRTGTDSPYFLVDHDDQRLLLWTASDKAGERALSQVVLIENLFGLLQQKLSSGKD